MPDHTLTTVLRTLPGARKHETMPLPVAHGRSAPDAGGPWLALDAGATPALQVRALRRHWEHFVSGAGVNGVRGPIADSWGRSLGAGVDPSGSRLAPTAADPGDAFALWDAHPLAEGAPVIRDRVGGIAHASDHLIVVSDAAGV